MNIVGIGNCQVSKLFCLFRRFNPQISTKYLTNTNKFGKFDQDAIEQALDSADVVVSQPIMNNNNPLYFEKIKEKCKNRIVFIPYIFIDGIFSLVLAPKALAPREISNGIPGFIYGGNVLDAMFTTDPSSPKDVIAAVIEGQLNFNNRERFDATVGELVRREKFCDIPISDFILDQLPHRLPMISHNHPAPEVLIELYLRLADKLGLSPLGAVTPPILELVTLGEKPRVFSPYDVDSLNLSYSYDQQWGYRTRHLVNMAWTQWMQRQGG